MQVYNLDGTYCRHFGNAFLRTPSVFAALGDHLLIGELKARLVTVDAYVATLGDGSRYLDERGWPNRRDASGEPIAPTDL